MAKRLFLSLLTGLLLLTTPSYVMAQSQSLPNPKKVGVGTEQSILGKGNNGNNETPGEWFVGKSPANPVPNAPVLLFVPGLNNVAQIFWEENGLYEAAYESGYETTFIQLYDAGGASADMWDNGKLLAEKIEEISAHFQGKPITVIAYSKGGVDTQAAVAYYGAWQYVDRIITLSSPHHGSELADLANSNWAGWLAQLLGLRGEGTAAVETGYMEYFRSLTDERPYAYVNDFYTFGGTDWGSMFSPTWFGGIYLSNYGANDGVVTAVSTRLPKGEEVAIGNWNHNSIRSNVLFPVLEEYIFAESQPTKPHSFNAGLEVRPATIEQYVYGSGLEKNKHTKHAFPIEEAVDKVNIQLYTASPLDEVQLVDPNGKNYLVTQVAKQNAGFFVGATGYSIQVDQPMAGEWSLKMLSDQENAYLLLSQFDKATKQQILTESPLNRGITNELSWKMNEAQVKEESMEMVYTIVESGERIPVMTSTIKGSFHLSKELSTLKKNQAYNITIDIKGETISGLPFKRTVVDSIYLSE
ncbi:MULTISPECIES: hypothetical protein [Clostridia]|uniref:lipase family alpha/beta hydrolase n=1 Tax=Clostridia TaxID=186801 RepID=UPI000EA286C6|nr:MULTISPECIES: hypothetical protein [Clostridia]NBJ68277.1 hypothetical protein [Roseburia sp. 1XD42-34]RKI82039.1 hypothetical protein D7V87_02135 [Clostridium sp. 1xD42-85]